MAGPYRCTKLLSQPRMYREQCVARGLNPELYDDCIGCMFTVNRKALRLNIIEEEIITPRRVKRIKRF